MASVHFTQNLTRHTECPTETLRPAPSPSCSSAISSAGPRVRSFVLDDQGEVRKHIKVLVDGRNLRDRHRLSDGLAENSEVYVFQALSGG